MKECEKCGIEVELISEKYGQSVIISCPICFNYVSSEFCKHPVDKTIKYLLNGTYRVQAMCSDCLKLHGSYLKHSGLDMNKIKTIDKEKYDKYQDEEGDKYRIRLAELHELHLKWSKTAWFDEHNEYLKSAEWQKRRSYVLERDDNTCQACLKARATQVHHLSYDHWRHEPLFELVSICKECHEEITKIDQSKK